jgi:hypothetical protein
LESYLKPFSTFFAGIFLRLDWVSRKVSPGERLSRFVPHQSWITPATGRVSQAAFMPPKRGGTSVYRTTRCSERKIWLLGIFFVERRRKDSIRIVGRADISSDRVLEQDLKIRPLLSPHPRHAELTNWPEDKAQRKDKALALAAASTPFLLPRSEF